MTINKIEEIVIYESPDGGKTVYARNSLSGDRELVKSLSENRWLKWKEILEASKDNPSLENAIKQAELIYEIIKKEQID